MDSPLYINVKVSYVIIFTDIILRRGDRGNANFVFWILFLSRAVVFRYDYSMYNASMPAIRKQRRDEPCTT